MTPLTYGRRHMRWVAITLVALVTLGLSAAPNLSEAQANGEITILHMNDLESALQPEGDGLGGVAKIATYVERVRQNTERMLTLSGGDNVLAGDFFNFFLGEATFKGMSEAGFDASGLGNHEFDRGEQTLADAIKNYAGFPYLASNLELDEESPLTPLMNGFETTTIDALRGGEHDNQIYQGLLVDHNGLNVCMFGLLDQEIQEAQLTQLGPNTNITDPVEAARDAKAMCNENGADLVVAMLHLAAAVRIDTEIKQAVPGIDVFVDGGTGAILDPEANPDNNVVRTEEGPSLSVQGPGDGNRVGRLDMTVQDGQIADFSYQNIPVVDDLGALEEETREQIETNFPDFPFSEAFAPDMDVQALVDEFAAEVEERLSEPVGATAVRLDGSTQTNRQRETNVGNYLSDCFVRRFGQADFALQNGGGIRSTQPAGDMTFRDVQAITPFGNTIVLIDLTGEQVMKALENSVSRYAATSGRYLQVSKQLQYAYDLSQPPGERVIEDSVTIKGEPLQMDKVYKVATVNFLVAGGDGYDEFTNAQSKLDTTFPQASASSECIKQDGTINPTLDGRVLGKIGWLRMEATTANLGSETTIRGLVTVGPGQAGLNDQTFYLQDSAYGLRVRVDGQVPENLSTGSLVEVTGTFTEAGNQFELQEASAEVVTSLGGDRDAEFNVQPQNPASVRLPNIQDNPEFYEGNFVRVQGIADPGGQLVDLSNAESGDASLTGVVEQREGVYQLRVLRE
ncbi:MAG: 5'-nucleotidase C-terminal domain-containing protein [Candidatus Bipolaricaulia bacterium]